MKNFLHLIIIMTQLVGFRTILYSLNSGGLNQNPKSWFTAGKANNSTKNLDFKIAIVPVLVAYQAPSLSPVIILDREMLMHITTRVLNEELTDLSINRSVDL